MGARQAEERPSSVEATASERLMPLDVTHLLVSTPSRSQGVNKGEYGSVQDKGSGGGGGGEYPASINKTADDTRPIPSDRPRLVGRCCHHSEEVRCVSLATPASERVLREAAVSASIPRISRRSGAIVSPSTSSTRALEGGSAGPARRVEAKGARELARGCSRDSRQQNVDCKKRPGAKGERGQYLTKRWRGRRISRDDSGRMRRTRDEGLKFGDKRELGGGGG